MPYVDVDIDLDAFHEDDLVDELQDRGYTVIRGELCDAEEIKELFKDYKAYGFTEKFRKILEDFFENVR